MFLFLIASGQLPKTDLYMLTLLNNGEKISLKDPIYMSGFNPDGYNNQPYFITPNELYITSDLYDKTYTDFLKLNIRTSKYYRVTATDSISEYSPTPRALSGYFSAIRVEKDGITQSLWIYPTNHKNDGKRLFMDIANVGYHCWLSEKEVALFLVDTPMKLSIGNLEDKSLTMIDTDIGRCFRQDDKGNLLYLHKTSESTWHLKSYNVENNTTTTITKTIANSEDFELLSDGTIVMGQGSKLYSLNPTIDKEWKQIVDLAEYDILNITRLAVSRNKLILVDNPKM